MAVRANLELPSQCLWKVICRVIKLRLQADANTNIGYKTDEATGFPTPVGLFDAVGNNGKELAEGTKGSCCSLFFRNVSNDSSPDQPITKVETKWTYHKGGDLTLEPSETFNMESGTDLTKGKWYVMWYSWW